MPTPPASTNDAWIARWLDAVTDTSMTQRRRSTIDRHGGIEALASAATARGVHLLLLVDDRGHEIVAASRRVFTVVC